jgi:hypothetical protein
MRPVIATAKKSQVAIFRRRDTTLPAHNALQDALKMRFIA